MLNGYKKLEKHVKTLSDNIAVDEAAIDKLKYSILMLENENKKLLINNENLTKQQLLSKKETSKQDDYSELDKTIDKIYTASQDKEILMILFELVFLIKDYKKIPNSLEESIKNSKIVSSLLNSFSLEYHKTSDNDKYVIEDFVGKIKERYKPILKSTKNQLKIEMQANMPKSLIFNARAVESIVSRLLIKATQFMTMNEFIYLTVSFIDKQLIIDLKFNIQKENKITNIFQSSKDVLCNSSQLSYQFNMKILQAHDGEIKTSFTKDKYNFILKIPAIIIKI